MGRLFCGSASLTWSVFCPFYRIKVVAKHDFHRPHEGISCLLLVFTEFKSDPKLGLPLVGFCCWHTRIVYENAYVLNRLFFL